MVIPTEMTSNDKQDLDGNLSQKNVDDVSPDIKEVEKYMLKD